MDTPKLFLALRLHPSHVKKMVVNIFVYVTDTEAINNAIY